MATIGTEPSAASAEQYCVGTLHYSRAGLFAVFGWLLWGDFCFTLMEKVLPEIYPLFLLNRLGASNTSSNILMTTIPWVMGGILCPIISFRSDRTRSRWGRRIPYMTFTAPLLCLFLVGLGFSDQIAVHLKTSGIPGLLHISPYATTLAVIGFLVVGFNLFNDFVNSVYWYLFADVVPRAFLGRFLGLFRMVGMGADVIFRKYVFPHADTHMRWIFLGVSVLYIVGFGLMCWRIKEGHYPPVENPQVEGSAWAQTKLYFRESFSHPLYVLLFCHSSGIALARVGLLANTVFLLSLPGIDLTKIGNVMAAVAVASMCLTYPAGWLADRVHPLRLSLLSGLLMVPAYGASFLFLHDYPSFLVLTWMTNVLFVIFSATTLPTYVSLFPLEKYGQFGSANALVRSAVVVVGGLFIGPFLDRMTAGGVNKLEYRWMYAWFTAWHLVGMACLVGVYILWKQRGGSSGYTPPGSIAERERMGLPQTALPLAVCEAESTRSAGE